MSLARFIRFLNNEVRTLALTLKDDPLEWEWDEQEGASDDSPQDAA